ncbi:hypothetical protein ACH4D4_11015 [Streptomyces pristinaespiralis]|uniref:hypothetical protein n=1 Tax=Streptomyces pristinaespiralis TaxID=38300 RepID=UPI003792BFDD
MATEIPEAVPSRPRRQLAIGGVILAAALFTGQTAAFIAQQQQIADMQTRASEPGPQGPPGPQGLPGPRGLTGPAGRDGKDGLAAPSEGAPETDADNNGRTLQMTHLEARAHCTELASKAWPESNSEDPTMYELTSSYTTAQRGEAFKQCMADEGWPQTLNEHLSAVTSAL